MENASKALIIAGAILISILLISVGVILVNSASGLSDQGKSTMNSSTIDSFNGQWTSYNGQVTGSELKALETKIRSSNINNEAHKVTLTADAATTTSGLINTKKYKVEVKYAAASSNSFTGANKLVGETTGGPTTEEGYIFEIHIDD